MTTSEQLMMEKAEEVVDAHIECLIASTIRAQTERGASKEDIADFLDWFCDVLAEHRRMALKNILRIVDGVECEAAEASDEPHHVH